MMNVNLISLCAFLEYIKDHSKSIGMSTFNYVIEQYEKLIEFDYEIMVIIAQIKHTCLFKEEGRFDFKNILANAIRTNENPTKRIFVLVGCSGAGKSTWIKRTVQLYDNYTVISRDDFIVEKYSSQVKSYLDFNDLYQQCWKISTNDRDADHIFGYHCEKQVEQFDTIFVDMTNLSGRPRARWRQLANKHKAILTCVVFDATKEECKKAQVGRDKVIDDEIIDDMFLRFEYPLLGIECNDIITVSRLRPHELN